MLLSEAVSLRGGLSQRVSFRGATRVYFILFILLFGSPTLSVFCYAFCFSGSTGVLSFCLYCFHTVSLVLDLVLPCFFLFLLLRERVIKGAMGKWRFSSHFFAFFCLVFLLSHYLCVCLWCFLFILSSLSFSFPINGRERGFNNKLAWGQTKHHQAS